MRARRGTGVVLAVAAMFSTAAGAPGGEEPIRWYFDADTARRAAEQSGRPIVVLKIRADVGRDVKT